MRDKSREKLLTGTGFERAAGYVAPPADPGSTGIDEQVRLIDDWATRHQSTVVEWHFDIAESTDLRLAQRPGGRALRQATQRGAYDAVVVTSLDVFGTDPEIILDAMKTITRERIPLVTIRGRMSPALRHAWRSAQLLPETGLLDPDSGETTLN